MLLNCCAKIYSISNFNISNIKNYFKFMYMPFGWFKISLKRHLRFLVLGSPIHGFNTRIYTRDCKSIAIHIYIYICIFKLHDFNCLKPLITSLGVNSRMHCTRAWEIVRFAMHKLTRKPGVRAWQIYRYIMFNKLLCVYTLKDWSERAIKIWYRKGCPFLFVVKALHVLYNLKIIVIVNSMRWICVECKKNTNKWRYTCK